MAYTPPDGGNIITNATGAYIPPDGGNIITGELPPAVIPEGSRTLVVPWGKSPLVAKASASGWRTPRSVEMSMAVGWRRWPELQAATAIGWRTGSAAETGIAVPWAGSTPARTKSVSSPWKRLRTVEQRRQVVWTDSDMVARNVAALFITPPTRNRQLVVVYRQSQPVLGIGKIVSWFNPPSKGIPHHTVWGPKFYKEICFRTYQPPPGGQIVTNTRTSIGQVDDGDDITILFDKFTYDRRCKHREPSGHRDAYFYRPPAKYPVTPHYLVLTTMNTALLKRSADNVPVEIRSMELTADIESWCWGFTARVPEASLAMVDPINEPVAVEAEINGYKWVVLIEGWSESRGRTKTEYTITGRSQSAILSDTYAPAASYVSTSAMNALQLAEAELENTGWTINWQLVDWLVSAGAFSYSNCTPIKVIQRLAEAAGGRILSHRTLPQLNVIPRLISLPWTWGSGTPALGISDYVIRQLGREYVPGAAFNAVFVSGENQGVCCKVFRAGTAGDLVAPMIIDALIGDVAPARERGKEAIGRSGKWSKETLLLPLTTSGVLPGLLEIGTLIETTEKGQPWRGQVAGIKVTADYNQGLKVGQNVTIERYRGN